MLVIWLKEYSNQQAMEKKVCVTGGAGYIGSALVKMLLQEGYTVHATLRNLEDESKVGLLRIFPGAENRLHLFEADMYKPEEFDRAIQGCEFVFHVATPLHHSGGVANISKVEATVDAMKQIAYSCIKSGTVKRLIYTASVVAASPLKDDGSGYKNSIDETCWTPLHLSFAHCQDFLKEYTEAKTLTEKEILSIVNESKGGMDVVTLACGLVGGESQTPSTPGSVQVFISQVVNNAITYNSMRFLEDLVGKIPIVHVEDVARAHILCAETPSINGRFLCTSSYVGSAEIAEYYQKNYPQFDIKQEYLEVPKTEIEWGSSKLEEKGFAYKYDTKMILDGCINYARKNGDLRL